METVLPRSQLALRDPELSEYCSSCTEANPSQYAATA